MSKNKNRNKSDLLSIASALNSLKTSSDVSLRSFFPICCNLQTDKIIIGSEIMEHTPKKVDLEMSGAVFVYVVRDRALNEIQSLNSSL